MPKKESNAQGATLDYGSTEEKEKIMNTFEFDAFIDGWNCFVPKFITLFN